MTGDQLTTEDLGVLIEAMDAWVNKDMGGEIMGDVLMAMVTPRDDLEGKAALKADTEMRRAKSKQDREMRGEQATLLKAKLIQMRRGIRQTQEFSVPA